LGLTILISAILKENQGFFALIATDGLLAWRVWHMLAVSARPKSAELSENVISRGKSSTESQKMKKRFLI
jgi:hypothetical protein